MCQRPYSIRTRIKTVGRDISLTTSENVRDHIPLEQGLRQGLHRGASCSSERQRPYSIRTRIKTVIVETSTKFENVRDHIPLEQGLRPMLMILLFANR